jgi:hypothetical protein
MRHAFLFAALLPVSTHAVAAPVVERYTVMAAGKSIGHLVATIDGREVGIDFDVKDNGRGPTIAERLTLDAQGLPEQWTITGATTFGSKVDERFERTGDRASWTDSVGPGSTNPTAPSLYIGQAASPWSLGVYARALLADADRSVPALPAGIVRIEQGEALSVSDGKATLAVRGYTITGVELNPSYILLDGNNALFAELSPRMIVIRKGFEGEEARLRELAAELSLKRLETIQAKTAHRYDTPVRIRNVRVFEPDRLALSAPVSVVVSGRSISGVQPLDSAATPGEVVIDGAGGTLVPGLYEMHAHAGQEGAILNIAAGVTSMRDMGNDNAMLQQLIERIESGRVAGPRITRSGFIEGKSAFNANNGILVDSEAQALDAVRWYAARGFEQVKLYNSMKPEWSIAAAAEAHRLGLRVAGHIPAFTNADAMIDAGYDELTHINQVALGWVLEPGEDTRTLLRLTALKRLGPLDLNSTRVQTTFGKIAARKVAVEPTIAIHEALLLSKNGETPRGMVDYLDHLPIGSQRDAKRAWADMSAPGDTEAYAAAYAKIIETLRLMRERGVLLVPGTDLGGSFTFHRELELFESLGFSRAEVLRRATLEMARYLGQDQQLGSIERGKLADFFLVAGDPTTDLRAIKAIRMVVKDGVVYFPAEIHGHFGIRPFAEAPAVTVPKAPASAAVH